VLVTAYKNDCTALDAANDFLILQALTVASSREDMVNRIRLAVLNTPDAHRVGTCVFFSGMMWEDSPQ